VKDNFGGVRDDIRVISVHFRAPFLGKI
jgi:hypothetical protein